ncbi:hypothetical protein KR018_004993 [Drosophila ironensis]|nr:hypothetical protein KR018_004993 [Drosophila ironensis]
MIRLLVILSCCLLLASGEKFDEVLTTTTGPLAEDFPNESIPLADLQESSPQEQEIMTAQKINWLPVYEEANQLRVAREVAEDDMTAMPAQTPDVVAAKENKQCPNDARRGLTNLIRVARPILPADRLGNILANAVEDPQVKGLIKVLRSDRVRDAVARLKATPQHQDLHAYICQKLKLDTSYYIEFLKVFLNIHTTERPSSPLPKRRPGIRGLMQDLRDALPRAALRDMYRRLYASDSELSNAVRLIRSSEFRRLLRNLRSLKDYVAVTDEIEKAGLSLRQVDQLVTNALGWTSVDLGTETMFLTL